MTQLARLKPYNERKGHLARVYMIDGARFYEERGWYEVTDDMADQLRELHQDHYNLDSEYLFDVVSPEDAQKIDERETKAQQNARATARQPAEVGGIRRRSPVNNAGPDSEEILGGDTTLRTRGGDTTTADLLKPVGDGDADEDVGRLTDIGRRDRAERGEDAAGEPKHRRKK